VIEMAKSYMDRLKISEMRIDEDLWGEGAEPIMREFLQNEYESPPMPVLAAADVNGREGVWLLGWEDEGTPYPNLLVYVFGQEYRDRQMNLIKMRRRQEAEAEGRFGIGRQR
jgi:hypothetical protein